MKRWLAVLLTVGVMLMLAVPALAHTEESSIKATFLGKDFDEVVYYNADVMRTLVHGQDLADILGFTYNYDTNSKTVTLTKGNITVSLVVGQKAATVNGQSTALDIGALDKGGEILLPIRFASEKFGYKVAWHQDQQHVQVDQ